MFANKFNIKLITKITMPDIKQRMAYILMVIAVVFTGCASVEQQQDNPANKADLSSEAVPINNKQPKPDTTSAAIATNMTSGKYIEYPQAAEFIKQMRAEGFSESYLQEILNNAVQQQSILKAISRPAEKRLNWGEYRNIFIKQDRIKQGVAFWQANQTILAQTEAKYGVPAEIIVAIIGVETRYGKITGNYRVLDALATLGFDYPKRSEFFLKQLKALLKLGRVEKIDITKLKGSYAGAMGYGQFMPTSYLDFAVDFDADGKRDIWNNKADAIGSVANYFVEHGWQAGKPVIDEVVFHQPIDKELCSKDLKPEITLLQWQHQSIEAANKLPLKGKATLLCLETKKGMQYQLGLHNFYVITRYNHSRLYAMAVYRLAEQIKLAYTKAQPTEK